MNQDLESKKDELIQYFDKTGSDYWKTIDEISIQTHVDRDVVMKIITSSGDFVRSSYRLKAGEPLFTTRRMFRHKAPFVDKLIGAFKNRID
jgi:hypothetical protein